MGAREKTRIELIEERPTALEVTIAAFRHLLENGRSVGPDELAARLKAQSAVVEARIQALERAGLVGRNESGEVTVAGGLSAQPTRHRMSFDGRDRFTCCAFDALGILGALGADGSIESASPSTGSSIRITFLHGLPEESDAVLFYADDSCCTSVLDEWCPNVNFFDTADEAKRWGEEKGVVGTVVGLRQAAERGAREWAPLVAEEGSGRIVG
jgi:alkylmercury lyase-like protein